MLYPPERLTGTPLGPPQIGGGFMQGGANGAKELLTNPLLQQDIPPLTCRLYRGEAGARKVIVTDGSVIEVLQAVGDSPVEHPVSGTRDTTYPNLYREYTISAAAPVVGVEFTVDRAGKITNTPSIAVYSVAASESLHYIPAVGPDAGQSGYCFYALAKLAGSGDDDYLEVLHAGSNIDYVADLATFKLVNGAVGKDLFKSFNQTLGQYEYRGLAGEYGSPLEVAYDEAGTDILVKWTNAKNLDLVVKSVELVESTESADITITSVSGVVPLVGESTDAILQHSGGGVTDEGLASPDTHRHSFGVSDGGGDPLTFLVINDHDDHKHTVTGTVEIKTYSIQLASPIYVVVFRNGLYHSVVASEAAAAAIPHTGTKEVKTIHQFNL